MDEKKCDKCGKLIIKEKHWQVQTNYINANGDICYVPDADINFAATFYLCKDCWKRFKEFIGVR